MRTYCSWFLAGLWFVVLPAVAAPPQVSKIAVPTLRPGGVTTLVIDGKNLGPNPRVLLPVPIVSQTVKDGATDAKVQIEVKLDQTPPGVYALRLASDQGISDPVGVEIDELPQQPFGPQVAQLPACLQGNLGGSATLATSFAGKKGQRVVVEVEARRLGSAISPVVKLYDPRRLQLAVARGSNEVGGDARLVARLPADGAYTIELHDLQYKAGNPNRFRLRIGDVQFADLAFPLAGQRGGKRSFQLIGSLPEATRVEADLAGQPGGSHVRLPRVAGLPGSSPTILVSDIPEVIESDPPAGKLQEVSVPAGINGRISKDKEEDRYLIKVQPGAKLRFDVRAERAGSTLDGVLVLRNEAGGQLARGDDQAGTLDPGLEYTVPAGVTALVAAVTDLQGSGGPSHIYRLAVTPVEMPDFSLELSDDTQHLPRNGAALLRVKASRSNYNGPIKLSLPGLPAGVVATGDEIPAGATDTLLSLTAPEGAPLGQAVVRVIGAATEPGVDLQRLALPAETAFTRAQPWLRGELAVAVTEPGPLAVAWEVADAKLPLGGSIPAKVKISRAAEFKGPVRLTLLTSQVPPKGKNNKEDVARTLRLDTSPTLAPDQTMADLKIVVPADLPPLPYDIAVRAELLGPDKKTVQHLAVTPARRLSAGKP